MPNNALQHYNLWYEVWSSLQKAMMCSYQPFKNAVWDGGVLSLQQAKLCYDCMVPTVQQ
jgi:hypothetical protein